MLKNEQLMASILATKMSRTEMPGRRNQIIHLNQSSQMLVREFNFHGSAL
jgi:hypothetical protein